MQFKNMNKCICHENGIQNMWTFLFFVKAATKKYTQNTYQYNTFLSESLLLKHLAQHCVFDGMILTA